MCDSLEDNYDLIKTIITSPEIVIVLNSNNWLPGIYNASGVMTQTIQSSLPIAIPIEPIVLSIVTASSSDWWVSTQIEIGVIKHNNLWVGCDWIS